MSKQRCLLVLDNLETLLTENHQWREAAYQQFLLDWFGLGGKSVILITSREQPDLPSNTLNNSRWYSIAGLSVERGVALLRNQQVQGREIELRDAVVKAYSHPLLLNLIVGFLREETGEPPQISGLKKLENLLKVTGLHGGDPQASVEAILRLTLERLTPDLANVLAQVWKFPMPFTAKVLLTQGMNVEDRQLRQLAKRSLLQETYQLEGWTFHFQPLVRNFLQQLLLNFYRSENDRLGEANTLRAIGDVLQFLKRSTEALSHYEQAIGIYREVGDRLGEANTLQAIGDVLQFLDRRTEALSHYEQAIGIYREVGDRLGEANVLQEFGQLQDEAAEALRFLEQAQTIYTQIGDRYSQSRNLIFFMSQVLWQLERFEDVQACLLQGLEIARTIPYPPFFEAAEERLSYLHQALNPSPLKRLITFPLYGKGRFILLAVAVFVLVLVMRLIFLR